MKMSATDAAIISMNTSYTDKIEAKIFISILRGTSEPIYWKHHLSVFFSEVPLAIINDLMIENGISKEQLQAVHDALPSVLQTKRFKYST